MADGDNDDTRLSERSVTDTADGDEEDTRLLERRVTDTADGDDEDTSVSDTADGDDEEVKGSEMDVAWAAWDGHVQALRGRAKRPRGGVEPPIPAEGKIPDPIVAEDMERGFSIPSSMLPDTTGVYRWLPIFRGSIRLMLLVQSFTRVRNAEILDLEMRLLFGNRLLEGKRAREGIEVIVDDGEGARGKGKGFWGRLGFGGVHGSEGASEPKERVDESLFRALWDYMREQTDHPRRKNREERYEETKWMTSLEKVKSVFEVGRFISSLLHCRRVSGPLQCG